MSVSARVYSKIKKKWGHRTSWAIWSDDEMLEGRPSKSNVEDESQNFQTIQVWNQDFDGIIYYIDDNGNVYDPVDIMQNNTNPKIINKYTKSADGNYSFVE